MTGSPLVVVAEDDDGAREGLAALLAADGWEVALHADAAAALADPRLPQAACLVTDLRLGAGPDGIALLREVRRLGSAPPVILATAFGDVPLAVAAMRDGASDFLEKPYPPEAMLEAVRRAVAAAVPGANPLDRLSPREREVAALVAKGMSNKETARALGIGPRTVETHRAAAMAKLGARSLAELVRLVAGR